MAFWGHCCGPLGLWRREEEVPVPFELLDTCTLGTDRESTRMRYSSATRDPNDFKSNGFSSRQVLYDPRRRKGVALRTALVRGAPVGDTRRQPNRDCPLALDNASNLVLFPDL